MEITHMVYLFDNGDYNQTEILMLPSHVYFIGLTATAMQGCGAIASDAPKMITSAFVGSVDLLSDFVCPTTLDSFYSPPHPFPSPLLPIPPSLLTINEKNATPPELRFYQ